MSKLHIKELWSCLSTMDTNSNESLMNLSEIYVLWKYDGILLIIIIITIVIILVLIIVPLIFIIIIIINNNNVSNKSIKLHAIYAGIRAPSTVVS